MPRRGKQMTYEERLACGKQAATGKTDRQIAQENGWSRWTVRKWRRVYQQAGETGLAPQLGRPKKGALSTYPAPVRRQLDRLRRSHPGWGPITLLTELASLASESEGRLPSRARIAAFLKEQQLVRKYARRVAHPQPTLAPARQAHEEWEMDAQGEQFVAGLGQVSVVNIIDVVSRLKVESYPHLWKAKLNWQDYQLVLRRAFLHYGLPRSITLDHDSAFFDNTSHSPYPSRLHLWLVGLGVAVLFIHQPPPRQHAIIERGHQTMTAQALTGQTWTSQPALWQGLDQRREFLNRRYPSRSLHYHAPLEAFPDARHPQHPYRPEWEADLLDLNRIYAFLAHGRWFRETSLHGEFWLGMQRYNAGRACAHTTQELTFDPLSRKLRAKTVGTGQLQLFPAKGLTKEDLMGELPPFTHLPCYQLALPFTRAVWLQNEVGLRISE